MDRQDDSSPGLAAPTLAVSILLSPKDAVQTSRRARPRRRRCAPMFPEVNFSQSPARSQFQGPHQSPPLKTEVMCDATAPHEALVMETLDRGTDCRGRVCPLGLGNATAPHLFILTGPSRYDGRGPDSAPCRLGSLGRRDQDTQRRGIAVQDSLHMFFASVLLFTLIFLVVVLLAARRSEGSLWRRLTAPLSLASGVALRFRVRTALAIIAILGLYLGWEINAWRTWTLRSSYLKKAAVAAMQEGGQQGLLQSHLERRARRLRLESAPPEDQSIPRFGYYRSKDSVAAERLADEEESERVVKETSALIAAIAARKPKYQRAAADPWKPVPADEPLPLGDLTAIDWLYRRDYPRTFAAYDELAQSISEPGRSLP